jgi:broad specificity phosphatase PhoE
MTAESLNRHAQAADLTPDTVVHLLRHGEVHNPEGILYGRRPGFHLSELGQAMAEKVAERIADRDITHIVSSPLERAQETAAPLAKLKGLTPVIDERVIESENWFEGKRFGVGDNALKHPSSWLKLYNPFKPSWGEPYKVIGERMFAAVHDAREAAQGHEAWVARLKAEGRSYLHDPRSRQCTLCSLTSFHFAGDRLVQISYAEPVGEMIPAKDKKAAFSTGGASEENRAL